MADQPLHEMSLEGLARDLSFAPGIRHHSAAAEMTRRQYVAQQETSKYQIMAAEAEVRAANAATVAAEAAVRGTQAAERNAKYMLASVIVAALAAIASAVSALATAYPIWMK